MPWVAHAGTAGTDRSANAAAVPGGSPLLTIAANPKRNAVGIQNQSTATLTVVRDDGTNTPTIIILSAAALAGGQGGDWSSLTFKGRLRVFGTVGSQVAAWED